MDDTLPPVEAEVDIAPNGAGSAFELIRDELYGRLLAEDPTKPQLAITLATLYARFESEVPETMAQLRGLFAMLDDVFGSSGGAGKMLGRLMGKKG